MTHLYFAVENANLSASQKDSMVAGLQGLGVDNNSPYPALRNHWRLRLDGNAAIFEGDFDTTTLSVTSVKSRLSTILNVAANTISHAVAQGDYGREVTFSYLAQEEQEVQAALKLTVFGHNGTTWGTLEESRSAAQAYLAANAAAWDGNA